MSYKMNPDGTVNIDETLDAMRTRLEAYNERQEQIAGALHALFDRPEHKSGTGEKRDYVEFGLKTALGADASNYKEVEAQVAAFLDAACGDRESGAAFGSVRGKGIVRWADEPVKAES